MSAEPLQLIMRPGVHPTRAVGKRVPPPPDYAELHQSGLLIQRNIAVRMRDGVRIFIDIYRPDIPSRNEPLPILLGWSPYGKHNTSDRLPWPAAGVEAGWISRYTAFEAPDPIYWCRYGYAVVYADPRGSWYSEGELRHGGPGEAQDCFDLIEWLGERSWSNGKIGMTGVSYLSAIQWQVAPLRPRALAAINPCEAFTDWYREFAYHGGIPETCFLVRGCANLQWSTTRTEDTPANASAHPLYDVYWASKSCDLEAIEAPAYVVASWSDQGLHTRGTLEGFKRISSPRKWLEVHGRKKWSWYYEPANTDKRREFFDHFLKQPGTRVPAWPKVLLEVRERANVGEVRAESAWPLARTEYRKLYLDARTGCMGEQPVSPSASVGYEAATGGTTFDHQFAKDTELTGHMKLRLWVESIGASDMDLFVAILKLDAAGREVPFVFYSMCENGPVALGWLRVSHRELDERQSRPQQPVHTHTREQLLSPEQRVAIDIEIWPSATRFRSGQHLRLIVQGRDVMTQAPPNSPFARHENTRNSGTHVIHTGGEYDSHLLIPVIPAAP